MFERKLDSKGKKLSQPTAMYDLCLDRRMTCRRQSSDLLQVKSIQERRNTDRRMDNRPLSEFPFLSSVI